MQPSNNPKRQPWWLAVALAATLITVPVAVWAGDTFTDVPASNIFHDDINWMADNGITSGCGGNNFCPTGNVNREQMSAFMKRLATKQVVDAATSLDSDALGGVAASSYVEEGEVDSVTAPMIKAGAVNASEIAADAVGASEIATGAVKTAEVANGSLTAVDLKDEPGGVQSVNGLTVFILDTMTTIQTVTIDAPAAGFVLVTGTAELTFDHSTGTGSRVNIAVMPATQDVYGADEDHDDGLPSSAPTGFYFSTVTVSKVFPVVAGSQDFKLVANNDAGTGNTATDAQLSALFFPSSYGSIATSSAATTQEVEH